jgi:hypothetical protein
MGLMVWSAARLRVSNHGAIAILRDPSLRDAPQDEDGKRNANKQGCCDAKRRISMSTFEAAA